MSQTPRQLNALILIGIGMLLFMSPRAVAPMLQGSVGPLVMAGVYLLSPLGLICLAIGIYRYATKLLILSAQTNQNTLFLNFLAKIFYVSGF